MNKSRLIYQSIALITLVIVFILFWYSSSGTTSVTMDAISHKIAADSYTELKSNLYIMIPVLCGALIISLVLAFYLEEWLSGTGWIYRIVSRQIAILSSIPSLLYGLVVINYVFFRGTEGSILPLTLILLLLVIPFSVKSIQQAIIDVDISVREAAYALGANRWRVVVDHVFPHALSNIIACICTAVSRVLSLTVLTIFIFVWRSSNLKEGDVFFIPSSVIILLSMALTCSILASLLEKKKDMI